MTQPVYQPSRPQTIGEVLDAAFGIFRISLVKCLPYGVLAIVAGQLPKAYLLATDQSTHQMPLRDPLWLTFSLLGVLILMIAFCAMMMRQFRMVTGQPVKTRVELAAALRRLPALVVMILPVILVVVLAIFAGARMSDNARLVALVLLAPVAIYLCVALSLSLALLLFELRGPFEALRRSIHLVTGSWWRAAAIYIVAALTGVVFYVIALVLLAISMQVAGANDIAMFTAALVVVAVALGSMGAPFFGAIFLALYSELKLRREGTDLAGRLAGGLPA
jgi:hypothetical protein